MLDNNNTYLKNYNKLIKTSLSGVSIKIPPANIHIKPNNTFDKKFNS